MVWPKTSGGTFTFDQPPGGWFGVGYATTRTKDWTNYRVHAHLGGLGGRGTASLLALVGSSAQADVRLSQGFARITVGSKTPRLLLSAHLVPAPAHDIDLEVRPSGIRVIIDGKEAVASGFEGDEATAPSGGIGVGAVRDSPTSPVPDVSDLTVTPLTGA
jgi:hypothetical protein